MRVYLTPDECATIRKALSHAGPPADAIAAKLTPPERLTAVLGGPGRDGEPNVPTCPKCGGQSFGYLEGCTNYVQGGAPEADGGPDGTGGAVPLWTNGWDDIGDSGDGDPGLFCDDIAGDGCGAPIDLPEGWEIAWG